MYKISIALVAIKLCIHAFSIAQINTPQQLWVKYENDNTSKLKIREYIYIDSTDYHINQIDGFKITVETCHRSGSSMYFVETGGMKWISSGEVAESLYEDLKPLMRQYPTASYEVKVDTSDQMEVQGILCHKVVIEKRDIELYVTEAFAHLPIKHELQKKFPEIKGFPLYIKQHINNKEEIEMASFVLTEFEEKQLPLPEGAQYTDVDRNTLDFMFLDRTNLPIEEGFKLIFEGLSRH